VKGTHRILSGYLQTKTKLPLLSLRWLSDSINTYKTLVSLVCQRMRRYAAVKSLCGRRVQPPSNDFYEFALHWISHTQSSLNDILDDTFASIRTLAQRFVTARDVLGSSKDRKHTLILWRPSEGPRLTINEPKGSSFSELKVVWRKRPDNKCRQLSRCEIISMSLTCNSKAKSLRSHALCKR
jgi:hypothetical protein